MHSAPSFCSSRASSSSARAPRPSIRKLSVHPPRLSNHKKLCPLPPRKPSRARAPVCLDPLLHRVASPLRLGHAAASRKKLPRPTRHHPLDSRPPLPSNPFAPSSSRARCDTSCTPRSIQRGFSCLRCGPGGRRGSGFRTRRIGGVGTHAVPSALIYPRDSWRATLILTDSYHQPSLST